MSASHQHRPQTGTVDDYTHILYVYPTEKNSEIAISIVNWGPNETSADGTIRFEDIRKVKRRFGSLPNWLTHVPTLVEIDTRTQWCGTKCIEKLSEWRESWVSRRKQIESGPPPHARGAISSTDMIEPAPIVLPPDPRDNLASYQRTANVPPAITEEEEEKVLLRDRQPVHYEEEDEDNVLNAIAAAANPIVYAPEPSFHDAEPAANQVRRDPVPPKEDLSRTMTLGVKVQRAPRTPMIVTSTSAVNNDQDCDDDAGGGG